MVTPRGCFPDIFVLIKLKVQPPTVIYGLTGLGSIIIGGVAWLGNYATPNFNLCR